MIVAVECVRCGEPVDYRTGHEACDQAAEAIDAHQSDRLTYQMGLLWPSDPDDRVSS